MRSSKSKVENQSNSKNQKTAYCNCQVTTLIGTPLRSPLEEGGSICELEHPSDVIVSPDEQTICVGDLGSHTIRVYDFEDGTLHTLFGMGGYGSRDGPANLCTFAYPHGLCFALDGNSIYVADTNNHAIRCLDLIAKKCTTIVGHKRIKGLQTGSFETTLLTEPRGIAVNREGNLLITTVSAVILLNMSTKNSSMMAGSATRGFKNGRVDESLFDHPDGMVYVEGLIFVADTFNHSLRVIDLEEGIVQTIAGMSDCGHIDGHCFSASFKFPQKIQLFTLPKGGKLLLITDLNDAIRVLDLNTHMLTTLAGNISSLSNGFLDGEGTSALFNFPYGIATMSAGRVLVADSDNHAIRLITLNHHLSPQATGITTGKIYDQNVDPKVKEITEEEGVVEKSVGESTPSTSKPPEEYKYESFESLSSHGTNVQTGISPLSSTALNMLLSTARESGRKITPNVVEIITSYTSRAGRGLLASLSGLAAFVLKKGRGSIGGEGAAFIRNLNWKEETYNVKVEIFSKDEANYLNKQIGIIRKLDDVKLSGMRVLFKWLEDINKAIQYFFIKLYKKPNNVSQQNSAIKNPEQKEKEKKNISFISPEVEKEIIILRTKVETQDKEIKSLNQENEEISNENVKLKEELVQFKDQFLTLMKLLNGILEDETIPLPNNLDIPEFQFK